MRVVAELERRCDNLRRQDVGKCSPGRSSEPDFVNPLGHACMRPDTTIEARTSVGAERVTGLKLAGASPNVGKRLGFAQDRQRFEERVVVIGTEQRRDPASVAGNFKPFVMQLGRLDEFGETPPRQRPPKSSSFTHKGFSLLRDGATTRVPTTTKTTVPTNQDLQVPYSLRVAASGRVLK